MNGKGGETVLILASNEFVDKCNGLSIPELILPDKQDQEIVNECIERLNFGEDRFLVMCTLIGIASRFSCNTLLIDKELAIIGKLLESNTAYRIIENTYLI